MRTYRLTFSERYCKAMGLWSSLRWI